MVAGQTRKRGQRVFITKASTAVCKKTIGLNTCIG
jgi:hypothetical protein